MHLSKEEILLRTRKKLFDRLHGEHESIVGGSGITFREVREYSSNDDIRHLNWKVTARTGTPHINLYNESKQIHILLVYLNSGGLYFGETKTKQDSAIEAVTSLSYAAIHAHDSLSTLFYADALHEWYAPSRHKGTVDRNFEIASNLSPLGQEVDFQTLTLLLEERLKTKSVIFLIGDFLSFTDKSDLGRIASEHELYCMVLRDTEEEELHWRGEYQITDPTTQHAQHLSIDHKTAQKYKALMQQHDERLFTHLAQHRITYQKCYTHEDTIEKLLDLVRQ